MKRIDWDWILSVIVLSYLCVLSLSNLNVKQNDVILWVMKIGIKARSLMYTHSLFLSVSFCVSLCVQKPSVQPKPEAGPPNSPWLTVSQYACQRRTTLYNHNKILTVSVQCTYTRWRKGFFRLSITTWLFLTLTHF